VQAEHGAENLGGLADGEADEGVQGVVGSGGGQAESEEGGARARELLTGRTDRERNDKRADVINRTVSVLAEHAPPPGHPRATHAPPTE